MQRSAAPSPTPTMSDGVRPSDGSPEGFELDRLDHSGRIEKERGATDTHSSALPGNRQVRPDARLQNLNKDDQEQWTVGWNGTEDPDDPLNTPLSKRWIMVAVLAGSCGCVTCCSSIAAGTYDGMEKQFGVSEEVCILSISFFVAGLAVGPLFLGPLSEFVGRSRVLHYSFATFLLLNFPVAFANYISVHLIFRFLTGFAGSAFISVSGGAISDVFPNAKVGTPMMIFSSAPFMGPVLGVIISGFINQNADWRWTYYVIIIWAAVMLVLLFGLVPETYSVELLRRRAVKLRKDTGQPWIAPIEKRHQTFLVALKKSIRTPFILLMTQPMVLFLDLWSAIILGVLYIFFGGVPYIFRTQHGFSLQQTGLAFLGIGFGQVCAVSSQTFFNRHYRTITASSPGGKAPPEARLVMGFYGACLCPLGLLLLGLLSFKHVPWILPILGSTFFGTGMLYAFTSTFTYLVDAYRPVAASALASNSFMRCAFATGFPLFGQQMYRRLGPVGATCLLGGLMVLTAPLPFIFHRVGARIRARSAFAHRES
ncbi:major facilitator superfamily domain-containing protein [Naematelia encephala]|uniref:Major facilitator superfamily domain-containing protein n=1 Tax=Naematelia encephala TaxID=71784 RepID=A0A1Y2B0D5_9TREE|nr:major facilitator superfamily domain-containing protein [Naematelia encephala]